MNHSRPPSISSTLLIALLIACAGCIGSAPLQGENTVEPDLAEMQPSDEIFNVFPSQRDRANQYPSVVMVTLSDDAECSGVLIHPRLVLTAGHCVCRGRQDNGTTTIDSSTCERTAKAMTATYDPSGQRPDILKTYTGRVRPHRDFKAVLKKKKFLIPSEEPARYVLVDTVEESKADLAVVFLDTPVDKMFLPTSLSKTNINLHESVIVVGYGADSVEKGLVVFSDAQATRRFGRNTIARADGEKFITESPGSLALPGDSGGPCFRKEATGLSVVGINSRSAPGKKATFTNTYQYLKWLNEEIQQAERQAERQVVESP